MKIGLCGTMSVGKSSLVRELSKLSEFKDYKIETEKSKELQEMGVKLNTDSTLKGQIIFAGYRSRELLNENLLTDRTIIDVMAFTSLSKTIDGDTKRNFMYMMAPLVKEYDIIFYISPKDMPIEDNGVRETNEEYRLKIDERIQSYLSVFPPNKLVKIVGGSVEDRIKIILHSIKE